MLFGDQIRSVVYAQEDALQAQSQGDRSKKSAWNRLSQAVQSKSGGPASTAATTSAGAFILQ